MAGKYKKHFIGDVLVDKEDPSRFYIKVKKDYMLKAGTYLNLESKQNQIDNIKKAASEGKIGEDMAEEILIKIEKMPDFVKFNVTKLEKN